MTQNIDNYKRYDLFININDLNINNNEIQNNNNNAFTNVIKSKVKIGLNNLL